MNTNTGKEIKNWPTDQDISTAADKAYQPYIEDAQGWDAVYNLEHSAFVKGANWLKSQLQLSMKCDEKWERFVKSCYEDKPESKEPAEGEEEFQCNLGYSYCSNKMTICKTKCNCHAVNPTPPEQPVKSAEDQIQYFIDAMRKIIVVADRPDHARGIAERAISHFKKEV